MRARLVLAVAAVMTAGALAGCGGGDEAEAADPAKLDDAATYACTDFAKDYKTAATKQARLDLSNKVNKWAATSKSEGIAANGKALANGANSSNDAWKLGADAFAQTCLDRGWTADSAK